MKKKFKDLKIMRSVIKNKIGEYYKGLTHF